jgi:hypothetical protein
VSAEISKSFHEIPYYHTMFKVVDAYEQKKQEKEDLGMV